MKILLSLSFMVVLLFCKEVTLDDMMNIDSNTNKNLYEVIESMEDEEALLILEVKTIWNCREVLTRINNNTGILVHPVSKTVDDSWCTIDTYTTHTEWR